MGRITYVTNDIWTDDAICDLPNDSYRLLYFRLLLNESNNIAGYFRVNTRHLAQDSKKSLKTMKDMLKADTTLWMYDEATEQVLIPTYLKYNNVRSVKQLSAVNFAIRQLKVCPLHLEFIKALEEYGGIGSVGAIDKGILRDCYKIASGDVDALKIIGAYI